MPSSRNASAKYRRNICGCTAASRRALKARPACMDDTRLHRLTPQELDAVCALARTVWQATYPALISQAQIDALLADRYAADRIRSQLDDPDHAWWIARRGRAAGGGARAGRGGGRGGRGKRGV